jgi:hypothetical protein
MEEEQDTRQRSTTERTRGKTDPGRSNRADTNLILHSPLKLREVHEAVGVAELGTLALL